MRPESVKNSTPPERTWLKVSVSEPSWLAGNTCSSKRPPVSCLMAAAISRARTFIGCVSGRLLDRFAILNAPSAAPPPATR